MEAIMKSFIFHVRLFVMFSKTSIHITILSFEVRGLNISDCNCVCTCAYAHRYLYTHEVLSKSFLTECMLRDITLSATGLVLGSII